MNISWRRFPLITTAICLLMAAGYLLWQGEMSLRSLYLVPQRFAFWSPFTSCFLHVSAAHLVGNLLWLIVFGTMVERAVRRAEYLLVLVAGGTVASLTQAWVILTFQPDRAGVPIMGASGMVAAVIGAFAVRFFAENVQVWKVSMPSLLPVALWLIAQLAGAMRTLIEGGGTVGYWGHLGGFITGLVLALSLRMTRAGARSYLLQQMTTAQRQGDLLQALRIAQGWCELEPGSVQAALTAARIAHTVGEESLSAKYYQQALALCDAQDETKTGVDTFLEARQHAVPLPPEVCLRWSLRAEQAGYWQEALEALQNLADTAQGTPEGENALLQSARITLQYLNQPLQAVALLERFLKQHPNSPLTAYALDLLRQAKSEAGRKGNR
ncbi:MAG: rhomboid family intramembrane serine protease [Chthonomonadetes bacterium]|nr:rhomboid family intramembrane serine protease [Chthonomonadetes bacterium]